MLLKKLKRTWSIRDEKETRSSRKKLMIKDRDVGIGEIGWARCVACGETERWGRTKSQD